MAATVGDDERLAALAERLVSAARTFTPAVSPKHQRRLAGFDEAVLSLYAKGMTTGDIANHLADIYGTDVSRELVSKVADAVISEMQEWQIATARCGVSGGADRCDPVESPRRPSRQPPGICGDGHHSGRAT
ncbi:transposase [Jatrophihabitans sp. GAS493]|uniref:transposase n=1 Tax=Jatrophihabitans sp. GAS493 TaxID=1907575 RepID=UPI00352B9BC4